MVARSAHDIATTVAYKTQCDSSFRELRLIHDRTKLSFCEIRGDFVYTMTIIPQGRDTIVCHYHFLPISSPVSRTQFQVIILTCLYSPAL